MARQSAKGLEPGTYITVARDGRRRARGQVLAVKSLSQGTFVSYRDAKSGAEHLTALENVRVARGDEKRRKAVAARRRTLTSADVVES